MNNLSKFLAVGMIAASTSLFTACSDDDKIDNPGNGGGETPEWVTGDQTTAANGNTVTVLTGSVDEDFTLTKDTQWIIIDKVFVQRGATLTIEPGTVIYGDTETKGALIVNRGAQINAVGTADEPIVFTSEQETGLRDRGDWAGVVLLGYAKTNNVANSDVEGQGALIEGIVGVEGSDDGRYGGNTQNDNSGKMEFVRIEFAGVALSPDNELNSLTFGGVGNQTEVNHIIVSHAGDDSYEWFGGESNHQYLVSTGCIDDDFDTDEGYRGILQYGVSIKDPMTADVSGSRAFEASSSKDAAAANGYHSQPVFLNFTAVGPYAFSESIHPYHQSGVRADRATEIEIYNSVLVGYPHGIQRQDKSGEIAPNAKFMNNYLAGHDETFVDIAGGGINDIVADNHEKATIADILNLPTTNYGDYVDGNVVPHLASELNASSINPADVIEGDADQSVIEDVDFVGAINPQGIQAEWNWTSNWMLMDAVNQPY
ncbi:hypothetical protein [Sediminitomix flava]|uniref:T9SS C-terminal target domain-containing protein n=1 Tax=Sediminitomix flava TaxID=379075 RepID=A0A315ZF66_SEDFL|nr:hypothetical protein [Sediminitomix flava]PWJ44195.1 hypothetical protein BC781_101545 [Sediminitomix flava]